MSIRSDWLLFGNTAKERGDMETKRKRNNGKAGYIAPKTYALWQEALNFIQRYQRKHGVPPTQARIARAIGVEQTEVSRYLRRMMLLGYITRAKDGLYYAGKPIPGNKLPDASA